MVLTDLLIGVLGGGVCVQLLQTFLHRRANARQLNANALGAEVEALEHTITVLRSTLDAEMERHERQLNLLVERLERLGACTPVSSRHRHPPRDALRRETRQSDAPHSFSEDNACAARPPP